MAVGKGGSSNDSSQNQNQSFSGTNTPVLSNNWTSAYNNFANGVNANGATTGQQSGIDWLNGNVTGNPVNGATTGANNFLTSANSNLQGINSQYTPITTQANYQSAGAPQVTAQSGAQNMGAYLNPYTNQVVNTTLANYDTNTNNQLNAMRASQDSAGAFGDRSAVAQGQFLNQSDANRAQTAATLYDTAFNTAAGYGQQDASRNLQADTTNAANTLANNQFNVNANYQGDQQKMAALQNQQANIAQQTGVNQQWLSNIVTANGINMQAAQAAVDAGQITQQQLQAIQQAATAGNGTTTSGTSQGLTTSGSSGKNGGISVG